MFSLLSIIILFYITSTNNNKYLCDVLSCQEKKNFYLIN